MDLTPEPVGFLLRAVKAVLKRLAGRPGTVIESGAIYQEVRVLASQGTEIRLANEPDTPMGLDLLDAVVRDALTILSQLDGVVVEYSLGSDGTRVVRVTRQSAVELPSNRQVEDVVQRTRGFLTTINQPDPPAATAGQPREPASIATKNAIDPRQHAASTLRMIKNEPL